MYQWLCTDRQWCRYFDIELRLGKMSEGCFELTPQVSVTQYRLLTSPPQQHCSYLVGKQAGRQAGLPGTAA
jgi:hypothetical protein